MRTTRYFEEEVLRKRPTNRRECERAVREPEYRETQPDGRVRFWIKVEEIGKYLRVVTLADGETVHNALPDRRFRPDRHEEHKV